MGTDGKLVAGYVLLGVGALLVVVAIILVIFLIQRRRNNGKTKRSNSPDTFKIVYKVPTANGVTTKIANDTLDARSVLTLRSEPGYRYVAPSNERAVSPVMVKAPSIVSSPPPVFVGPPTFSRPNSVDHVAVTLPRTGERFIVPAPNGTLPKILLPVSKKKAKKFKKTAAHTRPRFVYGTNTAASVLSAPAYVTSAPSVTSANNKYYLYGSTPNLAASHFTQARTDPTSLSEDEVDFGRPRSRASSVPTELEQVNLNALHARWSPSMRRRLDEMDRTEREHLSRVRQETQQNGGPNQLNRYSELAEAGKCKGSVGTQFKLTVALLFALRATLIANPRSAINCL
ncbi:hypothetical protein LSH36_485g02019 [Paralvinella palmiformis]|uniref:Uncharacterized protein n=1 Tax=Paralvinella palmiformis TaxID=53620 RepID=A0AAD9JA91_9ANNE|nr:hypothetical protein LSH36_485g02019 [Paralvinella palmiformis]